MAKERRKLLLNISVYKAGQTIGSNYDVSGFSSERAEKVAALRQLFATLISCCSMLNVPFGALVNDDEREVFREAINTPHGHVVGERIIYRPVPLR